MGIESEPLKVYSKVKPTICLSVIHFGDRLSSRLNLAASDEIIQASIVPLTNGKTVLGHRHKSIERTTIGTHEAWVVMSGSIRADIFDIDDTFVNSWTLSVGAIVLYQNGGHGLTSLEFNTVIYEFKNGPYGGPDDDKIPVKH